jgi:hypothetical protein
LAYSFILLCCSCLCYSRPMNSFLLYLDHCWRLVNVNVVETAD